MKIALIGTHGTGKTTLAHELVAALKKQNINAEFLGEIVRDCPLPINGDQTLKASEWIIYNQYVKELESEERCDLLVCDRSVVDGYVYRLNKFDRNFLLEKFVKEKSGTYSRIIRVPINNNFLQEDGIRSTVPGFQKTIDEKFDYILEELNINTQTYSNTPKLLSLIQKDLTKQTKT